MISREELAKVRHLNLYQAEKEYLQYVFLSSISKYQDVVFKGGTCLRICYGLERASEDLDFTTTKNLAEIKKMVKDCLKDYILLNIEHTKISEKEFQGNIRFEVTFKGPLWPGSTNTLKIDFNTRNIFSKNSKVITKKFSDVPIYTISVLPEDEILAEKIRCLANRKQPRDLYDVWMLIQKGVNVSPEILKKKLKEENVKIKDVIFPSKKEYEIDLNQLVSVLPGYEQVKKEVGVFLESI